ncbi:iron-containing alcohol dehydrogenase [Leptospira gomenensis]|uniref:iron-containing alcohol dehydrogenase n=1 Tax=Leptospira gomenensis TaxID=2484974 RepID=UPI0014384A8B|nr:iron-containing alcohol dehydrogenase [Leptospira gomenensis]
MEESAPQKKQPNNVVNLGLYKIKKTLREEGFEVVEKPNGKISLVIRVAKGKQS